MVIIYINLHAHLGKIIQNSTKLETLPAKYFSGALIY